LKINRGSKKPVLKNFFRKIFLGIVFSWRINRGSKKPVLKNFFRNIFLKNK
jgi:hypothetical protein